jgi:DNA-binding HxlR family transcriptional regulator
MSYETKLSCPLNRAVAALADKWKILIIIALQHRTSRFNELLRELEGIAPKVMVRQLRSLEADGLVERTVYPEVPPRVEYALTAAGRTLLPILNALQRWVVENAAQLSPTITGPNPVEFGEIAGPPAPVRGTAGAASQPGYFVTDRGENALGRESVVEGRGIAAAGLDAPREVVEQRQKRREVGGDRGVFRAG